MEPTCVILGWVYKNVLAHAAVGNGGKACRLVN